MSERRQFLDTLRSQSDNRDHSQHVSAALDIIPASIIIADSSAHILHANSAAVRMLAVGDPLSSQLGRLRTEKSVTTMSLLMAIRFTALGKRAATAEVPLSFRDGRAAIIHIKSIKHPGNALDNDQEATVALFLTEPEKDQLQPLNAIARLFDLTPGELRVLEHIFSGKNRKQTAAALSLSDSTVKTHLNRIYLKSGTRDQVSLSRLVDRLTWPR